MTEIWRPKSNQVYKDWLDTILTEASDSLTAWETKFISDIETRLNAGYSLSQAQAEKLESIYANKT